MEDLKGQRKWCSSKVFFFYKCCFGLFFGKKNPNERWRGRRGDGRRGHGSYRATKWGWKEQLLTAWSFVGGN